MTVREFSEKYGVPYHIVYEATYKVPAISTMRKDREFPEKELFHEVMQLVGDRRDKAFVRFDKLNVILNRLRCFS